MKTIREAATDLCDRWDTLLWKDVKHTAVFIHELRMALAQPEQEPLTEWLVCPKCSYKSPYSPIKARTLAEDAERITKQAREALAQPEQEPVSGQSRFIGEREWLRCSADHVRIILETPQLWKGYEARYLYTTPPKRGWVGLTGQEKALIASVSLDVHDAIYRANDKLKELNHG